MKAAFKAIGVAVGIFLVVELAALVIGAWVLGAGIPHNTQGLPTGPSTNEAMVVTIGNFGTICGLILATIGGIVYGVRSKP